MKKVIIMFCFWMTIFIANCQKSNFLNNFRTIELPFVVDFATFDIYASEESTELKESDVQQYLFSEEENFVKIKSKQNLKKNTYHDYFSVGKICKKDYIIVLYYRNFTTQTDDSYIELMLCVFDTKLNLLQTLSLSKFDTQSEDYSLCKINKDCEINIYHLTKEAVNAENMDIGIKKECKYIMKEEKSKSPFQELNVEL